METLILRTSSKFLFAILLLLSVFMLLRGHNEPGGGFIGALVAVGAYTLFALTNGFAVAKRMMPFNPIALIGMGLLVALGSGVPAVLNAKPFMTGVWFVLLGNKIGTPVIFDIGVYFVVMGALLAAIFAIEREEETLRRNKTQRKAD